MDEDRIIELETRVTFLEDLLDQLNQALSSQQLQLNETRDLIRVQKDRIEDLSAALEEGKSVAANEKPPHY